MGTAESNGFVIRRSREYLHDSMRAMYGAGQGHFFFATHEGKPLASIFVFTSGQKCWCWYIHGASSNGKRTLMPTYLLQWQVMRWARERGIRYYDMVAVPRPENLDEEDSLWGVYRFKVGFGGEIADFFVASIYPSNGYAPPRGTGSSQGTTGCTRS